MMTTARRNRKCCACTALLLVESLPLLVTPTLPLLLVPQMTAMRRCWDWVVDHATLGDDCSLRACHSPRDC